ncbi:hypothetical protein [Sphingopyxis sp.]|uniref:hypothetical protein n=1 Tax=Sphingopyxis sp. TaxID=1908224 RepID=UPI002EDBA4B5
MRLMLIASLLILPQMAGAAECGVDTVKVAERTQSLEEHYDLILSDISCDAPTVRAHILMCDAAYDSQADLWRMGRLDDMAWVYAYENATKKEVDHADPPRDDDFMRRRDACTDTACLCEVLIDHTNASLGGLSPYAGKQIETEG